MEAEIRASVTLNFFLYIHLAPNHLKRKMIKVVILYTYNFKHRCRNIYYVDQQLTGEEERNMSCSGSRINKKDLNQNTFLTTKGILVKVVSTTTMLEMTFIK